MSWERDRGRLECCRKTSSVIKNLFSENQGMRGKTSGKTERIERLVHCASLGHHYFVATNRGWKFDYAQTPHGQSDLRDHLLFVRRGNPPDRISLLPKNYFWSPTKFAVPHRQWFSF